MYAAHFPSKSSKQSFFSHPQLSVIARVLLVSVFVENAYQTLLDYKHHASFFHQAYSIPNGLALLLIAISTISSSVASAMLFIGPLQYQGTVLLLFNLFYQFLFYGSTSQFHNYNFESFSFIIRTLCLACTLILMLSQCSPDFPPNFNTKKSNLPHYNFHYCYQSNQISVILWKRDLVALITRVLLSLLCINMMVFENFQYTYPSYLFVIVGVVPVILSLLCGYTSNVVTVFLTAFYTYSAFSHCKFWLLSTSIQRHALRFQFVQTLSIISGLLLLFLTGPGHLSLDKRWNRQHNSHSIFNNQFLF